jgi:hypothetical protein
MYVPTPAMNKKRKDLARRFEDIDDVSSESSLDDNQFFDSY